MALHELYFENMTKQANGEINQSGDLYKMLSEKYGSFENF